jgi:hypothetical protein
MNKSETLNIFKPPRDARAALFFLEGNYQLNYLEGSVEKTKFLTPAQIGKAFAVKDVFDSGWLAANNVLRFALLARKRHKILSVLPAGIRKILVTDPRPANERETTGGIADPVLELIVPLPTLLFVGCGQKYYLWATLDKYVTPQSRLFAAPFPNLDSSGTICFGSNIAPECRLETIDEVWRVIFESPFNSHQKEDRCQTHKKDVRQFLLSLNGKKSYPKKALIKTEYSVGRLWEAVS